jgi:hypothetical protein
MAALKNIKWETFCQEYVSNHGNATRAYGASGYKGTDESLRKNACALMTKHDIKKRIKEVRKKLEDDATITTGELILEINEGMYDAKEGGQLSAYMKGIELKGKMIAAFTDKLEQTGKDGKAMEHKLEIEFVDSKKKKEK